MPFRMPLQQIIFEDIVTKGDIVYKKQFLLDNEQMFLHFFSRYNFIYRDFPYFCLDIFKVVLHIWCMLEILKCINDFKYKAE